MTQDSHVNDHVRVSGKFVAILCILYNRIHILLYYTHGTTAHIVPYAWYYCTHCTILCCTLVPCYDIPDPTLLHSTLAP